jgi:acyl-CoA reductase-like NAD-dependent aldehyde dehydrogenase
MAPVILGGVKEHMPVWQDEAFAFLAASMIVDDEEEAVKISNHGRYGLPASIFIEDLQKGLSLARKLESG